MVQGLIAGDREASWGGRGMPCPINSIRGVRGGCCFALPHQCDIRCVGVAGALPCPVSECMAEGSHAERDTGLDRLGVWFGAAAGRFEPDAPADDDGWVRMVGRLKAGFHMPSVVFFVMGCG